ncbi:MAG: hypothetical protein LUE19_04140 [Clostridiales bacterium]|nr:hypothetical protein [Clostridiales bacterium]
MKRMNRKSIVIAQVGKMNYREAHYQGKLGTVYDSKYSFDAVVREVCPASKPDEVQIVLVGTEDSVLGNVYRDFGSAIPGSAIEKCLCGEANPRSNAIEMWMIKDIAKDEILFAFESEMTEKFTEYFCLENMPVQARLAIIKYGKETEELQDNFTIIREKVEEAIRTESPDRASGSEVQEVDIYFDISNGFRSFPIYIYTLINYLSQIQNYQMRFHMYYGMFEAKSAPDGQGNEITPLVDLQIIDDMMSLIRAVSEFRSCGSVVQIRNLLGQNPGWDVRIGEREGETLSYAFNLFDYGTNANNLAAIKAAIDLLIGMGERLEGTPVTAAERLLMEDISRDFRERFDTAGCEYPYGRLMIRLAEWYHMQGREGNAAIAAQEAILTYMLERYPNEVNHCLKMDPPKGFPKEGTVDFSNPENLFCYSFRNPVKGLLDSLKPDAGQNDEMAEFLTIYKSVKNNIRNVMAHILLTGGTDVNEYRIAIDSLIRIIKREVDCGEEIFGEKLCAQMNSEINYLEISEEKKKRVGKILSELKGEGTGKDEEVNEKIAVPKDFTEKLSALKDQLERYKTMCIKQKFEDFYAARNDEFRLLFCMIDAWIKSGPNTVSKDIYRKYFQTKKDKRGNEKTGYDRLIGYMDTDKSKVCSVLDQYSKKF